ncbi:conserved membrane hypothetical protein [Arthrobacter sp. 9AX]|uniref:DUF1648 domain-containing protein n=1 Tax=Arthrobacter sp. 9AX TaxID=2653131 RepID=UPI0012EFDD08|nr:DUF1648 domain-containing protein [Arthrobacter sp. 9AX]VXB69681.1 conserved membrane hypothetical protein [Arthrobacter sp. 9AX]
MKMDPGKGRRRTWFVPSLLLLAATAVLGTALYPGMPNSVPVHWDGAGEPDRFAGKSVPAVFSSLLIGAGVVAFLWLLHRFLPAAAVKGGPADPQRAAIEATEGKRVLADLTPALAVLLCWLSIRGWLELAGPWTMWPPVVLLMVYAAILVVRAVRAASVPPAVPPAPR